MTIAQRDLASFDEANSQWRVDAGTYQLHVGDNAESIAHTVSFTEKEYTEKVNNVMAPQQPLNVLKQK